MRVEPEFAVRLGKKKKNRRHKKKITSTKTGGTRRKLPVQSMAQPAVQWLFDTCQEVFSRTSMVPSREGVARIKSILDTMTGEDVNLAPNMRYFQYSESQGPLAITYLHLYECDNFSIGIFCLPPSGKIPLHNHPHMTVFSKILFGSMHIKSYDWLQTPDYDATPTTRRLAKVKADSEFTAPCETSVLFPNEGGNMHCFTAVTPCAVLDVLGPPYSDEQGRPCTYYNYFPYETYPARDGRLESKNFEEYAWLEEREKPEDFIAVGAPYMGPTIIES